MPAVKVGSNTGRSYSFEVGTVSVAGHGGHSDITIEGTSYPHTAFSDLNNAPH